MPARIKILFINAINPSREIETKYPPLGIGYLASALRKQFDDTSLVFKMVDRNIEKEIMDFKPDIVGISSVTQNFNRAIQYAKIAKKLGMLVICGGVHITMMPYSLTKEMDIGVMREGEKTICDLLEIFAKCGHFKKEDLKQIRGIIYRNENDDIRITPPQELIEPLDQIPFPVRELYKIRSDTYMFTSRGCPYKCAFCASSRFWDKVRLFSAEYVVDEIEHLVQKYKVESIAFYDDIFVADKQRVKKIAELLSKRNLLGKIKFTCQARANLIDDHIVQILKKMNVYSVGIGFESGSAESLKHLKGKSVTLKDNLSAVKILKKNGINVQGSFIIGAPKETKQDILKTLQFIKKSGVDGFSVYVLTPFPGTPFWQYAQEKKIVDENMNWEKLNVNFIENYDQHPILSEKLTKKEIYKLFKKFENEQRIRDFFDLIKKGLKNPQKIPGFLIRNLSS